MTRTDYLIVGQGIAGSVLALTLHQRGYSVTIINKEGKSWSSSVAAGVYNPMNFRKMSPTWRAAMTSPLAAGFYSGAEKLTGMHFHRSRPILRIIQSEEEKAKWQEYTSDPGALFAKPITENGDIGSKLKAPHGMGWVDGGGVVDTGAFMYAVKEFFSAGNAYRDEWFDHEKLSVTEDRVIYDDRFTASRVVFAEGHFAIMNRFFPEIPLVPTKGEILHVHIPGLNAQEVINGAVYLAPLGNDLYVCGATFRPGQSDENVTVEAREELLSKLTSMISLPVRAESQFAGVRPAGRDKKPLVGKHRVHNNVFIFNGSGSKGILQSPLLAQQLVDFIEKGDALPRDVDIMRFRQMR